MKVAPEWPEAWPAMRSALLAVRRAAAARASGDRRAEERALVRLAAHPMFEGIRGDLSGAARGKAILVHVGTVASRVAAEAGEMTGSQQRALQLWERVITSGITAGSIAAEDLGVRSGRQSRERAA